MTERLSESRIRELWDAYDPEPLGWSGWEERALRDLEWVQTVPISELRSEAGQRHLWALQGLGSVGQTENYNVDEVLTDPEFVDRLVDLRELSLPVMPSERAAYLQQAFKDLEARFREVVSGEFTRARLVRVLHGLCPADLFATYKKEASVTLRRFITGDTGPDEVNHFVLARARLREVLDEEQTLADHVRRATFGWWLWEQRVVIADGHVPVVAGPVEPPVELELLPFHRRHRSQRMFQGGLATIRLIIRECHEPSTLEQAQQALQDELESLDVTERYANSLLRDLRHLGFVRREGNGFQATDDGRRLLQDRAQHLLAERLLERYLGQAEVLRAMSTKGSFGTSDVQAVLSTYFPQGSLDPQTRGRLWWAELSGMCERLDRFTWRVSDRGQRLAQRLPEDLGQPDVEPDPDVPIVEKPGAAEPAPGAPSFAAIRSAFDARCSARGLTFTPQQILALHAAWHFADERGADAPGAIKRFAILSGLSGTGKTQLLKQYSYAVCDVLELDPKKHIAEVAVRPDWRDPTGLLGYLNALHAQPTFQRQQALNLVLHAHRTPHLPHFLLLDEMNLARVERYFAPFLSSMENEAPLQLHALEGPIDGVPPTVPWPKNLRIGGSVNMDETTHPFSDKVLDRAFTLEFWEVDLDAFFEARPHRTQADAPVEELLRLLQEPLRSIRRHVGYRTAGEVLDWMGHARALGVAGVTEDQLLDQVVFSKVLPRLRGTDSRRFSEALATLRGICKDNDLARCAEKLDAMAERLHDTGVTGFWS